MFIDFRKIWHSYSYFKKLDLETPEYKFFWGNTEELFKKQYSTALREWTKKYGKLYGYYEGHRPVLVTSDLNMVNEIFVKQFNHFSARKFGPFQFNDNASDAHLVDSSRTRWKRMRNVINPTFTPAKLKEVISLFMRLSLYLKQKLSSRNVFGTPPFYYLKKI